MPLEAPPPQGTVRNRLRSIKPLTGQLLGISNGGGKILGELPIQFLSVVKISHFESCSDT